MIQPDLRLMLLLSLAVAAAYLLTMRCDPRGRVWRTIGQVIAGFLLLTAWNALTANPVGINPFSAWLTGALGLPGVGLTALLNLL